jgi:ABC-2 type transport system permease protein
MHNILLIARREYLERIRTKGFLVTTVLIPLLMAGGILGASMMGGHSKAEHIAVVSADQQLATDLESELAKSPNNNLTADVISPTGADTRDVLNHELDDKQLDGYLWITPAAAQPSSNPEARPHFAFTPRSGRDTATRDRLAAALRTVLLRERLAHSGMVAADVNALMQPVHIDTTQAAKAADAESAVAAAYVLFFLMYFVIMLHGMNVARSIIEEKSSRIFEVLLATIRPEEMMAGKVIGVGSVGLTQIAIWMAAAALLSSASRIIGSVSGGFHFVLSATQMGLFTLYFVLGFLLYSSVAAALGAMTNSEQELQQLNMFLVLPLACCMFLLGVVTTNPSGSLSTALSLIPFFSPLLMTLRIGLAMPAPWQIALSVALMLATSWAILWVASRIYRVGVLMYGKRPNLPEILRWLKYS